MREERVLTPAHFLTLLNDYFWRLSQFYDGRHLREKVLPKLDEVHMRIVRVVDFSYGLISLGAYVRAYLSELNQLIYEFVREYEEVVECSNCSEEDRMDKLDGVVYNFSLRLVVLEDEVKREYIQRVLEEFLNEHRAVLGKDFTLKDLWFILGRLVDVDEGEKQL
jgi:hypothetical protein